jgi:hypothetical protein
MLSKQEFADLSRVQARIRAWRWLRWVFILVGFGLVAIGLFMGRGMHRNLLDTTQQMSFTKSPTGAEVYFATQFSFLLGVAWLFTLVGGFFIGYGVVLWRGDPRERLLAAVAAHLTNTPEGGEKTESIVSEPS